MRRLLFLVLMALAMASGYAQATSGTTGDLTWALENGTLTIRGTGVMPDYDFNDNATPAPWYTYIRNQITTIVVESGVERIGNKAFYLCSNLVSVTLPESVTAIGDWAFYECSNLVSVTLPESVISIGAYAFSTCSSLASVAFPASVTTIGSAAFHYCRSLASIEFPASVTSIGTSAFSGCSSLTDVTVNWTTTPPVIGGTVFYYLTLSNINLHVPTGTKSVYEAASVWSGFKIVDPSCPSGTFGAGDVLAWELCDGTLTIGGTGAMPDYDNYSNNLAPWHSYRENITTVVVALGVESIGAFAFDFCSSLESIILPASVTSIGVGAFNGCDRLASITIPASVTAIGEGALYECPSLTDITVHWTTTPPSIDGVFYELAISNIKLHVPRGTKAIYEAAEVWRGFKIVDPSCPSGTFGAGDALAWELFGGTLTISGAGVMPDYEKAGEATPWYSYKASIKDVIVESGVKSIGAWAFALYSSLESILLSETLTSIGEYALMGCSSLVSITIPVLVTSIGGSAFSGCRSLADITVHWTTTPPVIYDYVFGMTLSNITLHVPSGTKAMYETAEIWKEFNIVDPAVSSCPSGTFGAGDALTWELCEGTLTISGAGAMPDYEKPGGKVAPWYSYREDIKDVVVASGVEHMGASAFYGCSLVSITLSESVISIGEYVFMNCSNLTDITVTWTTMPLRISGYAFSGLILSNITLHVPAGTKAMYEAAEIWKDFKIEDPSVSSCHSGTFGAGDALSWVLCEGTLTISGAGAIPDYHFLSMPPWSAYREDVTAVVVESGVNCVGGSAFEGFSRLESVTLPVSVTSIGFWAFYDCSRLASVILPETVTSIGESAFSGCSSLAGIRIPASVTSIEGRAFLGCSSLTGIEVASDNSYFSSEDGVLYDKNKATILCYPGGKTETSYIFPESVRTIGYYAFAYCNSLTDITVNWTATPPEINNEVFYQVTLSAITLHVPAGTRAIYEAAEVWSEFTIVEQPYPSGTFGAGDALRWEFCAGTLTISGSGAMPNYDKAINVAPWDSYREDISAVVIESGVERIGTYTFIEYRSLASITLPASVTSIGGYAFYSCSSLASVSLSTALISIGELAFFNCSSLASITLPAAVTSIGNSAFSGCSGLQSVLFSPASLLTSIERYVFSGCSSLESIILPASATSIGAFTFAGCYSLASITLPELLISIGDSAFEGCGSLVSIHIPAPVTSIGAATFSGCRSLTDVTVNWTTTPPTISSYVFEGLTLPTIKLHVPTGTKAIYAAAAVWKEFTIIDPSGATCPYGTFGTNNALMWELCEGTLTISGAGAIPDATMDRNLPWYTYREDITTLVIESGVQSIGRQAFLQYGSLTSVTLPASLTAIGQYAFAFCNRLAAIALPASLTTLGEGALASCERLTEINVSSNNPSYSSLNGVLFDKSRARLLQYPAGKADDSYTLPASVTAIGNSAFISCRRLESITIPASVTAIGSNAFTDCIGLSSITVGWTTTPPAINSNVFSGLTLSDLQLHVPSKMRAVYEAAAVWREFHIVDPSGCYSGTFGAGSSLTWELCDGLLVISGTGAMPDYGNLMAISAMGTAANASGNLPPWYAYREEITDVVIEAGVTSIGSGSFEGCDHLTDVTVNWTDVPPAITADAFSGLDLSTITLHVPDDAESLYGDAEVWKEFNIVKQSVGIQVVSRGLKVYVQDGVLHVGGLAVGEAWGVYDISGRLMHQRIANGGEAMVYLKVRGVYIVRTENRSVKTVY